MGIVLGMATMFLFPRFLKTLLRGLSYAVVQNRIVNEGSVAHTSQFRMATMVAELLRETKYQWHHIHTDFLENQ